MRLFVALDLDPEPRQRLGELVGQLRRTVCGGRISWVRPENMHITLRFLGETSPERAADVVQALNQVKAPCGPFEPIRWGAFPSPRNAKVIWAGSSQEQEENVAALAKEVELRLQSIGIEPEPKAFRAHVTVCRVREPASGLDEAFAACPLKGVGVSTPAQFVLKESRLGPGGPEYSDFASFDLAG